MIDISTVLNNLERFDRHALDDKIDYVTYDRSHDCWLWNKQTLTLYPLVKHEKAVFCTIDDIDEAALARIRSEWPTWNLEAEFRLWVFKDKNGLYRVEWTVQPDGQYYADEDGYGMTDDDEIIIHGYIDAQARVVGKFKLYR